MNLRLIRAFAVTAMLGTAAGPLGCGYLLYPERRGAQSGRIDSGTMVMDLLWLLPGLIPGVVALVVDFSSGAIYVRGSHALRLAPDGRLAVRLPHASTPTRLEFRLVTSSHRILAQKTAFVGPSTPDGQLIELEAVDSTQPQEEIHLEVHADNGVSARLPVSMEMTPGGSSRHGRVLSLGGASRCSDPQ